MAWKRDAPRVMPPDWPAIRRKVIVRDGGQCVWILPSGRRCPRRVDLEVDHVVQPMHGGSDHPDNLRTLCRAHHVKVTQRQSLAGKARITTRRRQESHPASVICTPPPDEKKDE